MLSEASISRSAHGGLEPSLHTGLKAWGRQGARLDAREQWSALEARMTEDADGHWLEVGFISPIRLDGSAATGWRQGNLALWLERSTDLRQWAAGHFRDCPGSPEAVAEGWQYWSRAMVPRLWYAVLCDLTATSARYGKSITGMTVQGSPVSLSYPYAMPADAAALQADLRTAGFTGALVTSASAALTAAAQNHTSGRVSRISLTMSGADVTAAAEADGTPITLPAAPYAMPSQQADLQADLRAAGQSGAVVMLYDDTWSILLPDISAVGYDRDFTLAIDPGDPYPAWDVFGTYLGIMPATVVFGTSGNVRSPAGHGLEENPRQFARLAVRHLT